MSFSKTNVVVNQLYVLMAFLKISFSKSNVVVNELYVLMAFLGCFIENDI